MMADYRLDDRGSTSVRGKGFILSYISKPALSPTQPPIQKVPGVKRGQGMTLTTHPSSVEIKNEY
jgi:hypothetical protein